MKTTMLPEHPDAKSPAGADIRFIPGTSIDIPVGTAFQYRNVSDVDLKFICIAMPPWPGESEAIDVKGIWQPTI
jgi:mannose-6-phosphate isomerase-like protein (cupin superfamily)